MGRSPARRKEAVIASKLKDALDGIIRLYQKRPERGASTLKVSGGLVDTTEMRFEVGGHTVTFDEPKAAGGTDRGPAPTKMTLAVLGACEVIIYRYFSELLEIPFDDLSVDVEGDVDFRGGLGWDEVRSGFSEIRMAVHLSGPEPRERYEELHRRVGRNCPVLDTISEPVRVTTSLEIGE